MQATFEYGNQCIGYEIIFTKRRTLEIAVHPGASVVVRAPLETSIEKIRTRVANRARWIQKQLDYFSRFEPRTPLRVYLSGETHLYLGRRYRLKVTGGICNSVKLKGGRFLISCIGDTGPSSVRDLLDDWYHAKAKQIFGECLDACMNKFEKLQIEKPGLRIRAMKRRWGSLSG